MTEARYRIGTVARLTGLSVDVLRAWERRYGFLEPRRGPGGQRLYTEEDLRLLRAVGRKLADGRSIGEIALLGREALLSSDASAESPESTAGARLETWRRQIVQAAISLDGERIQDLLDEAFGSVSPETVLFRVIEPAARDIGDEWDAGRCSVAGEHLASDLFSRRVLGMIQARGVTTGLGRARVICACFPDELHEIGALIVAYHLSRLGLRVTHLGASLPFEDLEAAIHRLRPEGVYLSVTRRVVLDAHRSRLLELVERHSNEVAFVIGGRGVVEHDEELARGGAILWPEARSAQELGEDLASAHREGRLRTR